MEAEPPSERANRPGEFALIVGIAALVALFVPAIGDFVALPAAATAMVLGFIGMRRHETGRAGGSGSAIAGLLLGAVAVTGTVVIYAATRSPV